MLKKWDKLRYFYYVADEKSLTRAAARLNTTQTTLSKHIKDLEHSLKTDLFIRRSQGMELTRSGESLFSTVKEIYAKTEILNDKFYNDKKEPEGELRILTTPGIASSWLMKYVPGFIKKYPKIHLTIIGSLKVEEAPFNGRMIKIISTQYLYYPIIQEYITTFNMNLYASENYLKKYGTPKNIKDLKQHKLISYENNKSGRLKGNTNWFMAGNTDSVLTVDSALALYYAAVADLGIVELPDQHPLLSSGKLKPIKLEEQTPQHTICCSYLRDYQRSETIKVFTKYLKDEVTKETSN